MTCKFVVWENGEEGWTSNYMTSMKSPSGFPFGKALTTTDRENSMPAQWHCCSGSLGRCLEGSGRMGFQLDDAQDNEHFVPSRQHDPWEKGAEGCTSSGRVYIECTTLDISEYAVIHSGMNFPGCNTFSGGQFRYARNEKGCTLYDATCRRSTSYWCATMFLCIYIGHVGSFFLIVGRMILSVALRMSMLQFDTERSSNLQELGIQYIRLAFWSFFTLGLVWWRQNRRNKLLRVVGGRRYSIHGRTERKSKRAVGIIFTILLCQGHAIQCANRIDSCPNYTIDLNPEDDTTATTWSSLTNQTEHQPISRRITENSTIVKFGIDDFVYPLPMTIGEALDHPRRLMLFPSWENLQELLTVGGYDENHEQKYTTFGHKGHGCGQRHLQFPNNNRAALLQEINRIWNDYIQGGSFLVHLIEPQPQELPKGHIGLIVEITVDDYSYDEFAAIYFEKFHYEDRSVDLYQMQTVTYINRACTVEDVHHLGAVAHICRDQSSCIVEHGGRRHRLQSGRLLVQPGSYIILQITPITWQHQPDPSQFFGKRDFKTAADSLVTDPEDPSVWILTNAVDSDNNNLGQRGLLLHQHFFGDFDLIWNLVDNEWSDQIDDPDLRIIFSHSPPQLELENAIHLIVINGPIPGRVPSLVSVVYNGEEEVTNDSFVETIALQIPTNPSVTQLIDMVNRHSDLRIHDDGGTVWCEDNYFAYDGQLHPEPGTHVLFFPSGDTVIEDGEESDLSDDPVTSASARLDLGLGLTIALSRSVLGQTVAGSPMLFTISAYLLCNPNKPWITDQTRPEPKKLRIPDDPNPPRESIRVCPIPETPWEAWAQRPPRTVIHMYDDLRYMLATARINLRQPALVDTYGLHDRSVGHRRVQVADLQQRTMVVAISQAWQDYATQFDLLIRIVRPQPAALMSPQPIITVIVQILDPFMDTVPGQVPILADQRASIDMDDTRQATTIRVAEYIQSPTRAGDVLPLVRLQNSCQPRGLRDCYILWRDGRYGLEDQIAARPGDYIIANARPLGVHFHGSDSFFFRARRFALEAQRLMNQLGVQSIDLDIHAIGLYNQPYGARSMVVTMGNLVDPRWIWQTSMELWGDRTPGHGARLYHIDPQPSFVQQPPNDLLHLILAFGDNENQVPILFGLTLCTLDNRFEQLAAFVPRWCRTSATDSHLLQRSTFIRLVRALAGQYAIYSGYRQVGAEHAVGILPGSFLTVQVHHEDRLQILHALLDRLDREESSSSSSTEPGAPSTAAEENVQEQHRSFCVRGVPRLGIVTTFAAPQIPNANLPLGTLWTLGAIGLLGSINPRRPSMDQTFYNTIPFPDNLGISSRRDVSGTTVDSETPNLPRARATHNLYNNPWMRCTRNDLHLQSLFDIAKHARYSFCCIYRIGDPIETLHGGSSKGLDCQTVQWGWCRLLNHVQRSSSNPPLWDVDAVFDRLNPPGNGHKAHQGEDFETLDIRGSPKLEYLDDFVVSGNKILLFDKPATKEYTAFTPPFDHHDAIELLQP